MRPLKYNVNAFGIFFEVINYNIIIRLNSHFVNVIIIYIYLYYIVDVFSLILRRISKKTNRGLAFK